MATTVPAPPPAPASASAPLARNPDRRGPDADRDRRPKTNYLLQASYRTTSVQELLTLSDDDARGLLERVRWGSLGGGEDSKARQACPKCGTIDSHFWCKTPKRWKCRAKTCGRQFTVLQGTRLHGSKKSAQELLALLFEFVEGKDSISTRQMCGKYDMAYHTAYVLLMKVREALADSLRAEPKLTGYIQADAAYFMKYVRPGNKGTGVALAAKRDQKNAGLDEEGKAKATVSKKMHALVIFVQAGPAGLRRYKTAVVQTENQVDLLTLGKEFCDRDAFLTTDGHAGYNLYTGAFQEHTVVDHSTEFYTEAGTHTNLAEGFFSRIRSAEAGAWHKMTLGHIEDYGWEFAWRQTMVARSNQEQLEDLLTRVLTTGRSTRFADYWAKSDRERPLLELEGTAKAVEIRPDTVPKKRGRPADGAVKPQTPEVPKRRYARRSSLVRGAGKQPEGGRLEGDGQAKEAAAPPD